MFLSLLRNVMFLSDRCLADCNAGDASPTLFETTSFVPITF